MLAKPFGEEIFPNIQSKPPLAQLEAVSSRPFMVNLIFYMGTVAFVAQETRLACSPSPRLVHLKMKTTFPTA